MREAAAASGASITGGMREEGVIAECGQQHTGLDAKARVRPPARPRLLDDGERMHIEPFGAVPARADAKMGRPCAPSAVCPGALPRAQASEAVAFIAGARSAPCAENEGLQEIVRICVQRRVAHAPAMERGGGRISTLMPVRILSLAGFR